MSTLREQGTIPMVPGRRHRMRPIRCDERRYTDCLRVEAMFSCLEDFYLIATRYDKLAKNFLSAVSLYSSLRTTLHLWLFAITPSMPRPRSQVSRLPDCVTT